MAWDGTKIWQFVTLCSTAQEGFTKILITWKNNTMTLQVYFQKQRVAFVIANKDISGWSMQRPIFLSLWNCPWKHKIPSNVGKGSLQKSAYKNHDINQSLLHCSIFYFETLYILLFVYIWTCRVMTASLRQWLLASRKQCLQSIPLVGVLHPIPNISIRNAHLFYYFSLVAWELWHVPFPWCFCNPRRSSYLVFSSHASTTSSRNYHTSLHSGIVSCSLKTPQSSSRSHCTSTDAFNMFMRTQCHWQLLWQAQYNLKWWWDETPGGNLGVAECGGICTKGSLGNLVIVR